MLIAKSIDSLFGDRHVEEQPLVLGPHHLPGPLCDLRSVEEDFELYLIRCGKIKRDAVRFLSGSIKRGCDGI